MVSIAKIVTSGRVQFQKNAECQSFSLILTSEMAPSVWIVVYWVSPTGEAIFDSKEITVEGLFHTHIELITSETHTKPSSPFEIAVETNPSALVGFLGIDQSVLLMKSDNDLNMKDVSNV